MAAKNICECENPPGGAAVCEPEQTAFCVVKNGVPRQYCKTPSGRNNEEKLKFIFTSITGVKVPRRNSLPTTVISFLKGDRYVTGMGTIITFKLPFYLRDYLDGMDDKWRGDEPPFEPLKPSPFDRPLRYLLRLGKKPKIKSTAGHITLTVH